MPRDWPHPEDGPPKLSLVEKLLSIIMFAATLLSVAGCARGLAEKAGMASPIVRAPVSAPVRETAPAGTNDAL